MRERANGCANEHPDGPHNTGVADAAGVTKRARFVRVAETGRRTFAITVDGVPVEAAEGDTLVVALLIARQSLRDSEFGDGRRAGFCLMGACQDCWVWTKDGQRLRACTTEASPGMEIVTRLTLIREGVWPHV